MRREKGERRKRDDQTNLKQNFFRAKKETKEAAEKPPGEAGHETDAEDRKT